MTWIDTVVVIIVVAVGLIILYKALKEPMDMLFGAIKNGLGFVGTKISEATEGGGDGYQEISYG